MPTLKDARVARRLSVRGMAARAGIGPSTIYRIEHGKTTPRPHIVRRLSAALQLPPHEIAEFQPVADALRLRGVVSAPPPPLVVEPVISRERGAD